MIGRVGEIGLDIPFDDAVSTPRVSQTLTNGRVAMALNPPLQPYDWTFRRVVWATLVIDKETID